MTSRLMCYSSAHGGQADGLHLREGRGTVRGERAAEAQASLLPCAALDCREADRAADHRHLQQALHRQEVHLPQGKAAYPFSSSKVKGCPEKSTLAPPCNVVLA